MTTFDERMQKLSETEPGLEKLSPADLSLKLQHVLDNPIYSRMFEIGREDDGDAYNIVGHADDQVVMGMKLHNARIDPLNTPQDKLAWQYLQQKRVGSTINATHEFAGYLAEAADRMGIESRDEFFAHPEDWDYDYLADVAAQNFIGTCNNLPLYEGLDGRTYDSASLDMRMFAIFMLLGEHGENKDSLKTVHDSLLEYVRNRDGELSEELLGKYEKQISYTAPSGKKLSSMNRVAGGRLDDYINTAAARLLVRNSSGRLQQDIDISKTREKYFELIKSLANVDIEDMIVQNRVLEELTITPDRVMLIPGHDSFEPAAELNWEVLPAGELERYAREIVGNAATKNMRPTIELERLKILDNVREMWGSENCYYAKGSLSGRKIISEDGRQEADQYLLLILQEKDTENNVVAEHAIAESPIAGPNALYVFRQDVSEGLDWREVMALPKKYARDLGARSLKHTKTGEGNVLIDTMSDRVMTLLAASKQEFGAIQFSNDRLYIPRSILESEV
ncbi:hypothetical protein GII36_03710 [Candidatus Mycosynbacter amalyticus]|uniref:Uncharacterized protein n=1 Tax=Candidatus Mycosynbacter amalyticus TaxID=2665156 RepID=A0A857MMA2_9BACT|nr:DUF3131 domain-containing protein [Candidatus Mycosynbacter amalyticus]QHN42945.1 hypothetical protein GII36_03710 [Candidatus Mycosynbacter amalyticus]